MKISLGTARFARPPLIIGTAIAMSLAIGGTWSPASAASHGSVSPAGGRSYTLPANVRTLKVNNETGSLRVTATRGSSQIQVVEQPSGNPTAHHNVAGTAATIGSSCPGVHISCHMDYQVTMPSGVALDVAGDVGQVTLQGGPDKAHIKTAAGRVSGTALGRGSYTVETTAGQVDLTFASAPALVKVTTDAGAINVTVPGNASYRISASSTIGTTDVALPNDASAPNVIDLHAQVGLVSVHKT
jgi:hypothetical protein